MLPVIEGVIARRILLNFRIDPSAARKVVPHPLKLQLVNGFAVAGICLIRLEQVRPKGLPAFAGFSSENMAQRFAVLFESAHGEEPGVYIARRDTPIVYLWRNWADDCFRGTTAVRNSPLRRLLTQLILTCGPRMAVQMCAFQAV